MNLRNWLMCLLAFVSILFGAQSSYAQSTRPMIFLPFQEGVAVYCSQGNSDTPTHSGSMAYAYDFTRGSEVGGTAGTALYAPFAGTVHTLVRNTTSTSGWGNTIVIRSGNYLLRLAHLQGNSIPSGLSVGSSVEQGQLVGRIGSTGNSTSAHLHIQMMLATDVNQSIPFDFVEGPVDYDEWLVSDLRANRYIVDNGGRVSLGAPLNNISVTSTGTFSTYSWVDGTHASNYRGSSSSGARFNWMFRLNLPYAVRSPKVAFWAHCSYSSTRDTATVYNVAPSSGTTLRRLVNQRDFSSYFNYLGYIGEQTYATGTRFTVSAVRGNNRMCADSIVVDLSW